jgi:hypothetical protein
MSQTKELVAASATSMILRIKKLRQSARTNRWLVAAAIAALILAAILSRVMAVATAESPA